MGTPVIVSPKTTMVELKHPYYSRRVQSKSEPSHNSQDSEVFDDELTFLPEVSEESTPTVSDGGQRCSMSANRKQTYRRVSAPPVKFNSAGAMSQIPKLLGQHQNTTESPLHLVLPNKANDHADSILPTKVTGSHISKDLHTNDCTTSSPNEATRVMERGKQISNRDQKQACTGVENTSSSDGADSTLNQHPANRSGKRGRGGYRGRRGRGGNRGGSAMNNDNQNASKT